MHINKYTQLTRSDRFKIYEGLKKGWSKRFIARWIGRSPGTIVREIQRNSDEIGYLYPDDAHEQSKKRKAKTPLKIETVNGLKDYVVNKLKQYWSPVAIAGRWSKDNPEHTIQSETIYRYIYSKEARSLELWRLLPRKKRKRGLSRKKRVSSTIKNRVSIHKRPPIIADRSTFGHYEADLFFNQGSMSKNVLTTVERLSRKVYLKRNNSKETIGVIKALKSCIGSIAKTVTFDNGTEFASHTELQKNGIPTYFCDPGKPWQKGSVEQIIKLMRRFVPFNRCYREINQQLLDEVADVMNNIPRKSLGFLTPNEVFDHFYQKNPSVALQI